MFGHVTLFLLVRNSLNCTRTIALPRNVQEKERIVTETENVLTESVCALLDGLVMLVNSVSPQLLYLLLLLLVPFFVLEFTRL